MDVNLAAWKLDPIVTSITFASRTTWRLQHCNASRCSNINFVFPTAMEMFSGLYPYIFSSEINNMTRSFKFALFVAQVYGHFVTLLDTPVMVASQINDKLLQQKSQLPDLASLGVVLLANRGISLAPGNQASVSVEHYF